MTGPTYDIRLRADIDQIDLRSLGLLDRLLVTKTVHDRCDVVKLISGSLKPILVWWDYAQATYRPLVAS